MIEISSVTKTLKKQKSLIMLRSHLKRERYTVFVGKMEQERRCYFVQSPD